MASELPPNYSVGEASLSNNPQLVIAPLPGAVGFQSGNLGADGERATVEGEVQLKGFAAEQWEEVTLALRTVETAQSETVELAASKVVLFSRKDNTNASSTILPSSLPFSIMLTPDIPQAITTAISSITHTLTADLVPANSSSQPFTRTVPIQIQRFSSETAPSLIAAPRSLSLDNPTPITIQLPRAVFRSGEMIPVYFSIPPPTDASLRDRGLQLRNVKAELIRTVKVGHVDAKQPEVSTRGGGSIRVSEGVTLSDDHAYLPEKGSVVQPPSLLEATTSGSGGADGARFETIITRSGAPARLHATKAVQVRLILHNGAQPVISAEDDAPVQDVDSAAGSITQSTLLHQVSFHVRVEVAFVTPTTHTGTSVEGSIPIVIIPALAPTPAADDLEASYMKKHDRPPVKTNRSIDDESGPPAFDDTIGSSAVDASASATIDPPPFSAEPSSTGGLPSFSESQAAASGSRIYGEPAGASQWQDSGPEIRFPGEGVTFGFTPEQQYDGLSHSVLVPRTTRTPPPAMASSVNDANVTDFAMLIGATSQPEAVVDASFVPPPPPPALDDPMDPPPSIDARFPPMHPAHPSDVPQADSVLPHPPPPDAHDTHPGQAGVDSGPPPYLGGSGVPSTAPPSYLDSR